MGDHFYTTDPAERIGALNTGYRDEGIECYVFAVGPVFAPPVPGSVVLNRLFNPDTGDHFYTTSASEAQNAVTSAGYRSEGFACWVFPSPTSGAIPLFRLWNGENDHFYTVSQNNKDSAIREADYRDEGIACYVLGGPVAPAVPFYRMYKPGGGFWDDVGDFFSGIGDALVGAASAVGGAIVDTIESIVGPLLNFLSMALELIFSIPYFGGFLRELWDLGLTIVWGALSALDFLAGLLGFMPEKRLKLMVIVQLDEKLNPVIDPKLVQPFIEAAIQTFHGQANVRIIPVGPFEYSSPFQDVPTAGLNYVHVEQRPSDADTLDVKCGDDVADFFDDVVDDLGVAGSKFNQKLTFDLFWANFRRVIGYGAPIGAFAVRSFKTRHVGCSLGPLSDYVVVDFTKANVRMLAHELGHACNLWHDDDRNNLMHPANDAGYSLSRVQKALLRTSRHATYF